MGAGLAVASVVGCGGGEEGPPGTSGPAGTTGTSTAVATGVIPTQESTPKAEQQQESLYLLPFQVEYDLTDPDNLNKYPAEQGWRWIRVESGIENRGNQPLELSENETGYRPVIRTAEGYEYGSNYDNQYVGIMNWFEPVVGLPPGFRCKGVIASGYGNDEVPCGDVTSMEELLGAFSPIGSWVFKVAQNTSGYRFSLPGFPELNLDEEIAKNSGLKYPTDRPDSDFPDIDGSSFTIGDGPIRLTFGPLKREPDLAGTGMVLGEGPFLSGLQYYSFDIESENLDAGYEHSFFFQMRSLADDGVVCYNSLVRELDEAVYVKDVCLQVPLGPGISTKSSLLLAFPASVASAKLILTGDVNEVFNCHLTP
jgi:hypothetical protein